MTTFMERPVIIEQPTRIVEPRLITPESEARQILLGARDMVKAGWVKGTWVQFDGNQKKVCAHQAIAEASIGYSFFATKVALTAMVDAVGGEIHTWNDRRFRTKSQVIRKFDKAIESIK